MTKSQLKFLNLEHHSKEFVSLRNIEIKRFLSLTILILIALSLGLTSAYRHSHYFSHSYWYHNQVPTQYGQSSSYKNLIKVYEGYNLEFGFPSESIRRRALQSGQYNPSAPIPIDVDVHYPQNGDNPRIFITVPRFGQGVPYSLAYLTDVKRPNGSEFQPYPNYEWHSSHGDNCNGLTSVYRVQIDSCGQMWVLDSGEIDFHQHCAPSVVVFDLETDTMIHRYFLPEDMFKRNISRFVTPIIDIADPAPYGSCKDAVAYLSDPTGVGFVVYDVKNGKSWRVENKYTFPNPDFGTHTIAGESFELLDGAFGFTITPPDLGLRRMLYFHALSHDMEVAIPLDVINNSTVWGNGISSGLDQFIPLGRRGVQCAAPAMTSHGIQLCGFMEPIGIFGWNIRTPYTKKNRVLLAENPYTLQFVSGMKVITNPITGKDDVWTVSNRLQKAFSGSMNFKEINYRIQRCGVDELLQGLNCKF